MAARIRIGTAGWAIPRTVAAAFPTEGSSLERYAARFDAVEVNSTFYRSHRPATWARWRQTTPESFRFAVKAPRAVTHLARLVGAQSAMAAFLDEVSQLSVKLGPVLVQLPPSLVFEGRIAGAFFEDLRGRFDGAVVCEPRHPTWFAGEADALLTDLRVTRAAADPACHAKASEPGGWPELVYVRLHGSPVMYRSSYGEERLAGLADQLSDSRAIEAWCVFDNTTSGAAADNVLRLAALLLGGGRC